MKRFILKFFNKQDIYNLFYMIDRPSVVGAVLQTASSLINSLSRSLSHGLWKNIFKAQSLPNSESKSLEILRWC